MDFGEALRAAKDGKRITREGWDLVGSKWVAGSVGSAGLYVWPRDLLGHNAIYEWAMALTESGGDMLRPIRVEPFLIMKTVQDTLIYGWSPSQIDMQADDWSIVEGD
jgi:hypothetical protein